jgi:hypothetical protein
MVMAVYIHMVMAVCIRSSSTARWGLLRIPVVRAPLLVDLDPAAVLAPTVSSRLDVQLGGHATARLVRGGRFGVLPVRFHWFVP